ncbi:MAG TPA: hypothetical protein VLB68_16680 [Pyrinomonadaceae bacterium]|nr:hypothetical protein [Pyrinomonadaceae bacterium]
MKRETLGQYVAEVCVGLDDERQAMARLEKDFQARRLTGFSNYESTLDSLRSDPRFVDLLGRMGLKP